MGSSNAGLIHSAVLAALEAASDIYTVEDWPADSKVWLAQFTGTDDRMPALHVSWKESFKPYTTDGDVEESDAYTITGAFRFSGSTRGEYVRLRDIVLAALNADWTFGGLADMSNPAECELGEQQGDVQQFTISFTLSHIWTP